VVGYNAPTTTYRSEDEDKVPIPTFIVDPILKALGPALKIWKALRSRRLSQEQIDLLVAAAAGDEFHLANISESIVPLIYVARRPFREANDPQQDLRDYHAFRGLQELRYVEHQSESMYILTKAGLDRATKLTHRRGGPFMKQIAVVVIVAGLIVGAFFLGRRSPPKSDEVHPVAAAPTSAPPSKADPEALAKIHMLRLQYLGSDDYPDLPPTQTELAYFQACIDEQVIENRRKAASLEYEQQYGNWPGGTPSDPVIRRAMKASHDVAMAAQADEIKALQKKMTALKAYTDEIAQRLGTPAPAASPSPLRPR